MPEIKNTFAQGKMNKDLDERLIPNGQYRHALNVSVDISDGSDVGAIENIKGNTRIDSFLQGSSSEDTPLIIGPYTCVGSIVDEANDVFYWFISSPNIDAIAQYNEATGVSSFVAVDIAQQSTDPDVERFLNFTGKPITGINIIDNFIFWTDGDTEPKRLNIDHLEKLTNTDQHSRLYVDGEDKGFIKEEHVTVIRKKPSIAPSFKINTSENTGRKPIFEKIFPRFSFRYKF